MNEANGKKIGLHIAAREGLLNIVKYYIEEMGYDVDSKDSYGCTSLFRAVIGREPEVVRYLIEKGADVNASSNSGVTVLHVAAYTGAADTAEFLIEQGADVSAKDNKGHTPLIYALRL